MGIPVLVLGPSGSGKSTSMRNFDTEEVGIFNVAGKPLPFRKKLNKIDNANYDKILKNKSSKKHSRIPSNLFYFHFINAWTELFCPFVKVFDII